MVDEEENAPLVNHKSAKEFNPQTTHRNTGAQGPDRKSL